MATVHVEVNVVSSVQLIRLYPAVIASALFVVGCSNVERSSPPSRTSPATDAAGLAKQLAWAERVTRNRSGSARERERAGQLQQLAVLELAKRPELREATLARLDGPVRQSTEANVEAGAALRAMVTPREALPKWRIVEPAPAEELLRYYCEAEREFGVPWPYLAAIHLVETRMGRIRGTSTAGAQGPMQFMPATWARFGQGDANDNRDAIFAAARYLRASGAPHDMGKALFEYNNSDRYVKAVDLYARNMMADPRAYYGYYHWRVYYLTTKGDVLLDVGYGE